MEQSKSNFVLRHFIVQVPGGEQVSLTPNHVLYLKYVEDIRSASIRIEAQITDSGNGMVSSLSGMEPVFVGWEDTEYKSCLLYTSPSPRD